MLTDDEARRLLQHAGETVQVDPAAPITDAPRRTVWPILVAAAAVIAIAVTSVVVANRGGGDGPDPAPPGPNTVQIPSVLGYHYVDARNLLTNEGLDVEVRSVRGCGDNRATSTEPAAGTSVQVSTTVTIDVVYAAVCGFTTTDFNLPWKLLAFADGRGPAPELADTVRLYDSSDDPTTISREQAVDPETWRTCGDGARCPSLLARLSEAAHRFYPVASDGETVYQSPALSAIELCRGIPAPVGLRGLDAMRIEVALPSDEMGCGQGFGLDVYLDGRGAIAAVVHRAAVPAFPSEDPPESAGANQTALAALFRDFTRGTGDLPPMADQVDLYLGNAFTGFVTKDSAPDRDAWETCTEIGTYAARSCPLSPLDVLRSHRQVDYVDAPQGTCMQTYGPLPPVLREADRVTIVPAEGSVDSCIDDFAVQLFTNDDGELIAVSLLLGEP